MKGSIKKGFLTVFLAVGIVILNQGFFSAKEIVVVREREQMLFQDIPVVITPAKHEQKITETPSTVDVITARDIENSGARTLGEILRELPGMDFKRVDIWTFVTPWGLGAEHQNQRMLCLVDGRPINNPTHGMFRMDLDGVPLYNVKRIEVIRGPGSALYGTNAVAGVINIFTKDPEDVAGLELLAGVGNDDDRKTFEENSYKYEVLYGKKGEEIEGIVTLRRNVTTRPHPWEENEDFADLHVFGKIKYSDLTLSMGHYEVDQGLPAMYIQTPYDREKLKKNFVNLSYQDDLISSLNVQARAYITQSNDWYKTQDFFAPGYPVTKGDINEQKMGSEIMVNYQILDDNLITGGVNIVNEKSGKFNKFGLEKAHERMTSSLYLQDEYRPIDSLIFTGGLRYDDYEMGSRWNPRISGVFVPNYRTSVRASYGEGYRAPNFIELYGEYSFGPVKWFGHPDLKPEILRTTEMSISHKFDPLLETRLNLFYNNGKDLISYSMKELESGAYLVNYMNKRKAEVKGFDIELNSRISSDISGFLNYTYQQSYDEYTGDELPLAPHNKVTLGLDIGILKYFKINPRIFYIDDSIDEDRQNTLKEQLIANLRLSGEFNDFEAALNLYNLTKEEYVHDMNLPYAVTSWITEVSYKF